MLHPIVFAFLFMLCVCLSCGLGSMVFGQIAGNPVLCVCLCAHASWELSKGVWSVPVTHWRPGAGRRACVGVGVCVTTDCNISWWGSPTHELRLCARACGLVCRCSGMCVHVYMRCVCDLMTLPTHTHTHTLQPPRHDRHHVIHCCREGSWISPGHPANVKTRLDGPEGDCAPAVRLFARGCALLVCALRWFWFLLTYVVGEMFWQLEPSAPEMESGSLGLAYTKLKGTKRGRGERVLMQSI